MMLVEGMDEQEIMRRALISVTTNDKMSTSSGILWVLVRIYT